jgi:acyl carrier protein
MEMADEIWQFICSNFYAANAARLANDASLLEGGIIDSTGVLELINFLESAYGVKVDDSEMVPDNLDSIDKIVAFVRRKRATPLTTAA